MNNLLNFYVDFTNFAMDKVKETAPGTRKEANRSLKGQEMSVLNKFYLFYIFPDRKYFILGKDFIHLE